MIDWMKVLALSQPVPETLFRGSVMYLMLLMLLRVLSKEPTSLSISDLLVIVLIADAAQNGMSGGYTSLTEGILLVAVILSWSWLLDFFAYRFPRFGKLIHPPPLPLIRDGRVEERNLRREYITREELMSQLREQGIEEMASIKRAYLEGDGKISVITRKKKAAV